MNGKWQDNEGNSFTIDGQHITFSDTPYWKDNFDIVSGKNYDSCLSNDDIVLSVKKNGKPLVFKKFSLTDDSWVVDNEEKHIFFLR